MLLDHCLQLRVDIHLKQIHTSANTKANPEEQEDAGQEAYTQSKADAAGKQCS